MPTQSGWPKKQFINSHYFTPNSYSLHANQPRATSKACNEWRSRIWQVGGDSRKWRFLHLFSRQFRHQLYRLNVQNYKYLICSDLCEWVIRRRGFDVVLFNCFFLTEPCMLTGNCLLTGVSLIHSFIC